MHATATISTRPVSMARKSSSRSPGGAPRSVVFLFHPRGDLRGEGPAECRALGTSAGEAGLYLGSTTALSSRGAIGGDGGAHHGGQASFRTPSGAGGRGPRPPPHNCTDVIVCALHLVDGAFKPTSAAGTDPLGPRWWGCAPSTRGRSRIFVPSCSRHDLHILYPRRRLRTALIGSPALP
jgi:hypothetical protein